MEQDQAIDCFAAMAQESRIEIFRLLMRHSPDGLRVTDISMKLGIVPSTLSGHLAVLKRAGLLKSKRNQRDIVYSAELETINDLMLFILEECCDGNVDSCRKTFRLLMPEVEAAE